jgi:hypothetical protein
MPSISRRSWLLLIFLLALGIRLYRLGHLPLNDAEARLALQAWELAEGRAGKLDSQLLYIYPTAILFFLFGPFDALARFWPALSGSLLILLPWALRRRLGERVALLFALFLALDPGMVAFSRQANAWMPLLFALGMMAVSLEQGQYPRAALFAALAFLAGLPFWEGVLLGILILILLRFLRTTSWPFSLPAEGWQQGAPAFLATLLFGGTLFSFAPAGLGAVWNAPLELVRFWGEPQMSLGDRLLALTGYEALPLLLTLGFLLLRPLERRWYILLGVTFFLPLLVPAAPSSWVWFLTVLLFLASRALDDFLSHIALDGSPGVGLLVSFLLLSFISINLTGYLQDPSQPINAQSLLLYGRPFLPLRLLAIAGASLFLLTALILLAIEWGKKQAMDALGLSLLLLWGLFMLGNLVSVTGLRLQDRLELWPAPQAAPQLRLLEQTIQELSLWSSGHRQAQTVLLAGWQEPPPSLQWALRHHPLKHSQIVQLDGSEVLVITPPILPESLAVPYRGQDFIFLTRPARERQPIHLWQWLLFRRLPSEQETLILWVRNDLFDYKSSTR